MNHLILAVTTIGDLLLHNKITRKRDGKAIEHIRLKIPEYQRPYKWTARNAIQLLDDIIEAQNANKEVYRVGTLILHRDEKEEGVYNIVDGQQRTITFSLLLYALMAYAPNPENKEGKEDKIAFLNESVFNNPYSRRNIPNNLNAFKRRTQRRKNQENDDSDHDRNMRSLREFVVNRCELIVVITDNLSEAFQFFDSQNARGKALYPHDLLKAYHLREMADMDEDKVERIVKEWEKIQQKDLADFFGNYIYRIKEWINGNWAEGLNERNIYKFKGITRSACTPFAQFYKSAYSYAEFINHSAMPFVSGTRGVNAFQLNTPIIAGKPFFDYTRHYYAILKDIQDNNKYEGFYIQDNAIVKTLDRYYRKGVGNKICRLLFDTALLLYVDRFCPATFPTKVDSELFEQFVIFAFVWAYSLRAQYTHLGWQSAQNYVLERNQGVVVNTVNIYKMIADSDTPLSLLSGLTNVLTPLCEEDILDKKVADGLHEELLDTSDGEGVFLNYLHFFKENRFFM